MIMEAKMIPSKILVIDDELEIGEFFCVVAEGMNFEARAIADPTELSNIYSADTDIIVLDIFMPKMDGVEVIRLLAELGCTSSLILTSGSGRDILNSVQNLANEHGLHVLGVLEKPVHKKSLEALLTDFRRPRDKAISGARNGPSLMELCEALTADEFTVFYQPQIEMSTRELAGVEALVRWIRPDGSMVSPGDFIPLAEKSGLIDDLTSVVMGQALSQCKKWLLDGLKTRVSVNVSPRTLKRLNQPEIFSELVLAKGLDCSQLVVEVTETALMDNLVKSLDILTRLRIKGFTLSIDDFGTGYSSMEQLVRAPFGELKVDQAFVKHMSKNKECRSIAKISIGLAHELGMRAVAEGIEDEETWDILAEMGCDVGQGYWMAKPMPGEEVLGWLEEWKQQSIAA